MSHRREQDERELSRKWRKFVLESSELFQIAGFPLYIQEKKERFDHWLMHGYHPEDHSRFLLEHLNPATRRALLKLVRAYLDAGFKNPGITILTDAELSSLPKSPALPAYPVQSKSKRSSHHRSRGKNS